MPKVNQQRIADQLKISRTTVSRSLSNHPAIAPATRALVLEMAAKLGYHLGEPRGPVRRAARKPSTIGVLIGMPATAHTMDEAFRHVLRGVTERASSMDIRVDVDFHDPASFDPERPQVGGARNEMWRGAILIYPFPPETIKALSRRISAVSIVEDYGDAGIDCIDTDQNDGIIRLVRRLAGLGHRRIGFLSWPYTVPTPWVQRRFGAFVEASFSLGLEFHPDWVINVRKGEHVGASELAGWVTRLVREKHVTAFVCAADHQAYPLIASLREQGVKVPVDCSITGFDGIDAPPHLPALTTLRVAYEHMGAAAVTRLVGRMLNLSAPRRHILIGGTIIPGATTARPHGTS